MITVLDYIRSIKYDEYDLTPPEFYSKSSYLNIEHPGKHDTWFRNYKMVSNVIKEKISGFIDYHIVIVDTYNKVIIGFNKEYIYICFRIIEEWKVTMFRLEELNDEDFYLILKYGSILKKKYII